MSHQHSAMLPVSIERIMQDEKKLPSQPHDSFSLSYKEFVLYFKDLKTITAHHFVVGAYFIYGWMPTILELKKPHENVPHVVAILNDVKHGKLVGIQELALL